MLKIAVIGLGDIAQKAYLPILTAMSGIELVFCTRQADRLQDIAHQYRVAHTETDYRQLPQQGIHAAFVHTATSAHFEITDFLLRHGIDVYLDKPLSDHGPESAALIKLAQEQGRILMTGFNRRFAPLYQALKQPEIMPELIILQKNRVFQPGKLREFVFDDFIHVVDTLLFLAPSEVQEMSVKAKIIDGLTHHIQLNLSGSGFQATGIMHRDSGSTEETLELLASGNKWRVDGMHTSIHYASGVETRSYLKDWDSSLYRRGFTQIIQEFLDAVRAGQSGKRSNSMNLSMNQKDLASHLLCERIVQTLS